MPWLLGLICIMCSMQRIPWEAQGLWVQDQALDTGLVKGARGTQEWTLDLPPYQLSCKSCVARPP